MGFNSAVKGLMLEKSKEIY